MKFKTNAGELWLGDCLELMKEILDGSVDLVLTDPLMVKSTNIQAD